MTKPYEYNEKKDIKKEIIKLYKDKEYLTVKEIEEKLNISENTARKYLLFLIYSQDILNVRSVYVLNPEKHIN
jgi:response regulator of citrate/malate metabolism